MSTPYTDPQIRDWFFAAIAPVLFEEDVITTIGSDPFDEDEFDDFLRTRGVVPRYLTNQTNIFVVGREEWDEDQLGALLDMRRGQELRIYSQEMFLCLLATHRDPFDDPTILPGFRNGHPALEFLSQIGFRWPDTVVHDHASGQGSGDASIPKEGLLSQMGYKVGKRGLSVERRRAILTNVYQCTLQPIISDEYMQKWGAPRSSRRLKQMADNIAYFCWREKHKNSPSHEAITDWENDLDWLFATYYYGKHSFNWPQTYVD